MADPLEALAAKMFAAYWAQEASIVPVPWAQIAAQVKAKWMAAARVAQDTAVREAKDAVIRHDNEREG